MNKTFALLLGLALLAACGKQEAPATAPATPASAAGSSASAESPAAPPVTADAQTPAATSDSASLPPEPVTENASAAATTSTANNPVATASASAGATAVPPPAAAKPAAPAAAAPVTASAAGSNANGDPGTLVRAETLRARPAADAPEAGSLAAGVAVRINNRDGGWYQITAEGKTGWVRMLSVRRSEAASTSIAGIAGIASGRTGTGKVVTTTGVRGLDSEELQTAVFDEARIARAENLRVTRQDAEAFARQGGLAKQDVPALPAK